MASRSAGGDETRLRLISWSRGQTEAEGLAAQVLWSEGYEGIDPTHPRGGPDGLKDVVCFHEGKKWIGAFYFAPSQTGFPATRKKFVHDLEGVTKNNADGIAFVTNQPITDGQRNQIANLVPNHLADIYHLERLVTILNRPVNYGVRLEFLDIEMTKEEQLAFFKDRDASLAELVRILHDLNNKVEMQGSIDDQLRRLLNILRPYLGYKDPFLRLTGLDKLFGEHPTLEQVVQFLDTLRDLSDTLPGALEHLRELQSLMKQLSGDSSWPTRLLRLMQNENPPLTVKQANSDVREYAHALDEAISKQMQFQKLLTENAKLQKSGLSDFNEPSEAIDGEGDPAT